QIAPQARRVALIFNPSTTPFELYLRSMDAAAPSFSVEVAPVPIRDAADIEGKIAAFATEPSGSLIVMPDIFTSSHRAPIISAAARHGLPAIYPFRFFAVNGGLMAYGVDPVESYRGVAGSVDRTLKGENPGDLPVQAPTKLGLVINLKPAKALGLIIPDKPLAIADEVIE